MNQKKLKLYLLIRSWNSFQYFDQCINSVFRQNYDNYQIIFVDDASDYTHSQKKYIKQKLKEHIIVFNKKRYFSLRNAYNCIHTFCIDTDSIVVNLDGDDYLYSENALEIIASTYLQFNCLLTYGECVLIRSGLHSTLNRIPSRFLLKGLNIRYPKEIEINNDYRDYYFIPLHARTWRTDLFKKIKKDDFLDNEKKWLKTCEDQAMFLPMLEMAKTNYAVIKQPLYGYRMNHSISDAILYKNQQEIDSKTIRMKKKYNPITGF